MHNIRTEGDRRRSIRLRREHHNSLCEAVNKVLDTGVVALGEVKLSVAEVDLVYVGLQLVVTSIQKSDDTFAGESWHGDSEPIPADSVVRHEPEKTVTPPQTSVRQPVGGALEVVSTPVPETSMKPILSAPDTAVSILPATTDEGGRAKNGLGQLVLTVVKLLHELMKKQALRRVEGGSLSEAQIERLGETLMRQAKELERLRNEFGLKDDDLNLDLGPLGKLF
jgi:hypothetical protein